MKPRKRRENATPHYPAAAELLEARAAIRETVIACEVPATEIEDVTSTCLVAAWVAIQRGDFRPHAHVDPAEALRRWLRGITWRLSMHERHRAHHRREVLSPNPWALATTRPGLALQEPIAARAPGRSRGRT